MMDFSLLEQTADQLTPRDVSEKGSLTGSEFGHYRSDYSSGGSASARSERSTKHSKLQSAFYTKMLRHASSGAYEPLFAMLDNSKVDVNDIRVRGSTLVHEAAKGGHRAIVKELLSRGGKAEVVNKNGCTALHFAVLCKNKGPAISIVQELLSASGAVNRANDRRDTILHYATFCGPSPGTSDIVRCLVAHKAEVNSKNSKVETPLFNAAICDNADAVKALVELRADMWHRNTQNKTALDVARERSCAAVVQLLEIDMKKLDPENQAREVSAAADSLKSAIRNSPVLEMLKRDLELQAALAEAHHAAAVAAFKELEASAQVAVITRAFASVQKFDQFLRGAKKSRAQHSSELGAGNGMLSQGEEDLLQALMTLLTVAKTCSGFQLLHNMGVNEILPLLEQAVEIIDVGMSQVHEFKTLLLEKQWLTEKQAPEAEFTIKASNDSLGGDRGQMSKTPSAASSPGGLATAPAMQKTHSLNSGQSIPHSAAEESATGSAGSSSLPVVTLTRSGSLGKLPLPLMAPTHSAASKEGRSLRDVFNASTSV